MENSYILGRGVDEDKQTLWDIGMHFFPRKMKKLVYVRGKNMEVEVPVIFELFLSLYI